MEFNGSEVQELRTDVDYFNCSPFLNNETGKYAIKESIFDNHEVQGYQHQWYNVAAGFNTIDEVQQWLNDKRKEQVIFEQNQ